MSGVDKPIMDKAAELFGWAYGLGGFDVAVLEFVKFVRAQVLQRLAPELERYDIQGGDGNGVYPDKDKDGEWCKADEALAGYAVRDARIADLEARLLDANARLNGPPVSEAKAQGLVMPERETELFNAAYGAAVESGWESVKCMARQIWDAARLNAAPVQHGTKAEISQSGCRCVRYGKGNPHWPCPLHSAHVQQVSVPDGWKLVPVNATEAVLDVLYSNGMDESDSLLQDIWSAMIAAAPAAPAADAWIPVGERPPSVAAGKAIEVIVAVKRKHNGQVYVFTTEYLNCVQVNQDGQFVQDDDNDNAAITGWFYLSDDEETWHRTLGDGDELLAWQYKPAYAAHRAKGVV